MADEQQTIRLLRRKQAVGAIDLRKRRFWFEDNPDKPEPSTDDKPKTPEAEGSSDSWLDKLPEEQAAYIRELRRENASRRNEAKQVKQQLEQLTKAQQDAEAAKLAEQNEWQKLYEQEKQAREKLLNDLKAEQMNTLRLNIAAQYKLPPQLASRLVGTDEDSLRADAEELAKLIPGGSAATADQTPARSRQTTSAVPDGQPTKETDDQRRARLNPRFNRPSIFDSVDIIVHGD